MTTLRLSEHERRRGVELTGPQIGAIRAAGARIRILATSRRGIYDVEAAEIVGTIVAPDLRVRIEPKTPIRNLLYFMGYAPDSIRFAEATQLGDGAELVDAMAAVYAEALERALQYGGLVVEYRNVEEAAAAVRGRVDWLAIEARQFGIFPPVPSTVSELTVDSELNRRLYAACVHLARACTETGISRRLIRSIVQHFVDVSIVRLSPRSLHRLHLDRRTKRFEVALSIAETVLRNASFDITGMSTDTLGFLVNMNEIFEEFVVSALGNAFRHHRYTLKHHPEGLSLDVNRQVGIEPDGILYDGNGRPRLVLDAKYKVVPSVKNADVYQMLSYCTAMGVSHGALIYADARDASYCVQNSVCEIHVFGVDLDADVESLRLRIEDITTQLIALVTPPSTAA